MIWSIFSSMKTAIVLLAMLTVASIGATIYEDKTGVSVYGSTWYSMILTLVGINLAVCSISKFGTAWNRTVNPKTAATPERVAGMARSEKMSSSMSSDETARRVIGALKARSFRLIRIDKDSANIAIYAAKGRAAVWGPYLTHLSLLVIFAGAIFGKAMGTDGFTMITEGNRVKTYAVPTDEKSNKEMPLGFEVGLRSFTIKHDKEHNPIGYKSDLQVFEDGKVTAQKVIDVNQPLAYKGWLFHQSSYGLTGIEFKVTDPNGKSVFLGYNIGMQGGDEGMQYAITDNPMQQIELGGKKITLFVHHLVPDYVGGEQINRSMMPLNPAVDVMVNDQYPEGGLKAWQRLGWMCNGTAVNYKGYTITVSRVVKYTQLQVSRDPGLVVVYIGFALMVLGVFMSFYIQHKIVRVSIVSETGGAAVVMGATSRADLRGFDRDFNKVHKALS